MKILVFVLGVVLLGNGCSAKKAAEVNDRGKTKDARAVTDKLDAGQPGVVVGEAPARTSAIAVAGSHVWLSDGDRAYRYPLAGGEREGFALMGATRGFHVTGGKLYYLVSASGEVVSLDLASKQIEGIAKSPELPSTDGFAGDDSALFWTTAEGLYRLGLSAAEPTQLVRGERLAQPIAVDSSSVYFVAGDELRRVAKTGGEAASLGQVKAPLAALVADDQRVYWVDGLGRIASVQKQGGEVVVHAQGASIAASLSVDHGKIYWAEPGDQPGAGRLRMATTGAGGVTEVLGKLVKPTVAIAHQGAIYWVDFVAGSETQAVLYRRSRQ